MIVDRIKLYANYKGITINKFETSSGMSRGSLRYIKQSIGSDKLVGIMEAFPELNIEWLISGKGDMIKTENANSLNQKEEEKLSNLLNNLSKSSNTEDAADIILGLSRTIAKMDKDMQQIIDKKQRLEKFLLEKGFKDVI